MRSQSSWAPKRYLYGSLPAQEVERARAVRRRRTRAHEGRARCPGASRANARSQPAGRPRTCRATRTRRAHRRSGPRGARPRRRARDPVPRARLSRPWKASWSVPNDPLCPCRALRVQLEERLEQRLVDLRAAGPTRSRTPFRSSRRVKRRSWRTKSPEGARRPSASGSGTRGHAVDVDGTSAVRERVRRPVGSGAAHEQRGTRGRFSEPLGHVAAAVGRHQPGAVVGVARAAAGVGVDRAPPAAGGGAVARDPDSARRARPARRRRSARPPRACAGARAIVSHHASTQSGVWKYELPSSRSASSSQSGSSARAAGELLEVDDLRRYAGSLRRASLSLPHRSKLAALTRSTGSDRPGPRGDMCILRSRRLIRLTDSARSLNSV